MMIREKFNESDHPRKDNGEFGSGGGSSHEALHERFDKSIDSADHLTPEAKEKYKAAVRKTTQRMPKKAVETIHENVKATNWHKDAASVTEAMRKRNPKKFEGRPNLSVGGAFNMGSGELNLDGNTGRIADKLGGARTNIHETYAHELSHALDKHSGGKHSDSPEFKEAFDSELAGGQLSKYATSNTAEGWAEFGRMVFGTSIPTKEIEKRFPKTTKIWKDKGIWPE